MKNKKKQQEKVTWKQSSCINQRWNLAGELSGPGPLPQPSGNRNNLKIHEK